MVDAGAAKSLALVVFVPDATHVGQRQFRFVFTASPAVKLSHAVRFGALDWRQQPLLSWADSWFGYG